MNSLDILRAPGFGILTFSTGGHGAAAYFKKRHRGRRVEAWSSEVARALTASVRDGQPFVLGVPSDSGGGICRGAAHGPLGLREIMAERGHVLARYDVGDVACIPQLVHDSMLNSVQLERSGRALWGADWRPGQAVSPLSLLESTLVEALEREPQARPLTLGGDHSISGPVFLALSRLGLTRNLAVLHVDAHTDLLEERFGIEHCFATWTSYAVKQLSNPRAWVQVGIRTTGRDRAHWESKFGLRQLWAKELRRKDPLAVGRELVRSWRELGCDRLYVTIDIDGIDAGEASATGTPEASGLSSPWLRKLLKHITSELPLQGADLVEVAPVLGAPAAARRTLRAAAGLLESLNWSTRS